FLRPFRTPYRLCFPRFAQRFMRSFVPVLDHRMLLEIPHRLLFILGLNALTSKSPIHLRRRQLPAAAGTEEEQTKNFQWGLRRNSDNGRDQRNRGQQSNRSTNSGTSS
nr:hypothetical protein [Tanacetum cinerariifolium]